MADLLLASAYKVMNPIHPNQFNDVLLLIEFIGVHVALLSHSHISLSLLFSCEVRETGIIDGTF